MKINRVMEKYIPLDALVKEIENLQNTYKICSIHNSYEGGLRDALHIIKTLEAKEVENTELLKVRGYLVRDKDDYTAIYSTKPNRGRTEWVDGNHPRNANESSCLITLNNARLLPDIEFNDKPIEVEVVIKAQRGE